MMYSYGAPMGADWHWIAWPFFVIGALIGLLLILIWIVLVIWALLDIAKYKPRHSLAWFFVVLFGHIMGPIGYYFIIARDRMIRK